MRLAAGFLFLFVWGFSEGAFSADTNNPAFIPSNPALLLPGRFVFQKNCVFCHGKRGDGKGEMGLTLRPRPRDFTAGTFKYRSTPTGALPTDADLARTIRQGIAGTAMPTFALLPDRDIRAVIEYVKSFSPKWNDPANFALPVPLPETPLWFSEPDELSRRANRGHALFISMCAPCHGASGAGDGPAATNSLIDVWGQQVFPADLRLPQIRSGPKRRDIYKVLVTGLNGTPMPSFAESTTEQERWELVAFIERLRRDQAKDRSNAEPQRITDE